MCDPGISLWWDNLFLGGCTGLSRLGALTCFIKTTCCNHMRRKTAFKDAEQAPVSDIDCKVQEVSRNICTNPFQIGLISDGDVFPLAPYPTSKALVEKTFQAPKSLVSTFGGSVRLRYGFYMNASVRYRFGIVRTLTVRYRLVFASARCCGKILLKRPWLAKPYADFGCMPNQGGFLQLRMASWCTAMTSSQHIAVSLCCYSVP